MTLINLGHNHIPHRACPCVSIMSQVERMGPALQTSHLCAPENADSTSQMDEHRHTGEKASAPSLCPPQTPIPHLEEVPVAQPGSLRCLLKAMVALGGCWRAWQQVEAIPGHSPYAPVLDHSFQGHLWLEKSGLASAIWGKTHPWKSRCFLIPR